jgi:hypothetical protein
MIQIDGFYLYSFGYSIHPLAEIRQEQKLDDWAYPLFTARYAIEEFLQRSVFQIRTSRVAAQKLLKAVTDLVNMYPRDEAITFVEAINITNALSEFEHVLAAEMGMFNLWLVQKKRGYDTTDLIQQGWVLFPEDLILKVPEAVTDVAAGTRCMAFNLATAAGFHLHRMNESVLHRYYDAVTEGAPRPQGRNIGDYLAKLKEFGKGDEKTLSALKDLKDLHRNPLIHPEDSLDNIDEAIALLGSIQAAVVSMLKAIPAPEQPVLAAKIGG